MSLLQAIQRLRPAKKRKVQQEVAAHSPSSTISNLDTQIPDPHQAAVQDAFTPHSPAANTAAANTLSTSLLDREPEAAEDHASTELHQLTDCRGGAGACISPGSTEQAVPEAKPFPSNFYAGSQGRSSTVDRKIEAYLRGAQQILRSKDAAYVIKSFPLQEPAFQFADQHPGASQLRFDRPSPEAA